jgi:hypothetical protein
VGSTPRKNHHNDLTKNSRSNSLRTEAKKASKGQELNTADEKGRTLTGTVSFADSQAQGPKSQIDVHCPSL